MQERGKRGHQFHLFKTALRRLSQQAKLFVKVLELHRRQQKFVLFSVDSISIEEVLLKGRVPFVFARGLEVRQTCTRGVVKVCLRILQIRAKVRHVHACGKRIHSVVARPHCDCDTCTTLVERRGG